MRRGGAGKAGRAKAATEDIEVIGSRTVAYPREQVWAALAVVPDYCGVCDVSYRLLSDPPLGVGTTFRCAPGSTPPERGVEGEIVEYSPQDRIATRLTPGREAWTVRIELDALDPETTRVTLTVSVRLDGTPFERRTARRAQQATADNTLKQELERLIPHIEQPASV